MKTNWHEYIPELLFKDFLRKVYLKFFPTLCEESFDGELYHYKFRNGIEIVMVKPEFTDFTAPLKGYLRYWKPMEDDIILDIGSYVGIFSIYCSKAMNNTGKIYAFEPNPTNYKQLLKNIKLNRCTNIVPIKKGIWDKEEEIEFSDNDSSSTIFCNIKDLKMQATTIDKFCKDFKRLDYIKMDIQGADIEALKGGKETINKFHPFIAAGVVEREGELTWKILEPMLKEMGYKSWTTSPYYLTTYGNYPSYDYWRAVNGKKKAMAISSALRLENDKNKFKEEMKK